MSIPDPATGGMATPRRVRHDPRFPEKSIVTQPSPRLCGFDRLVAWEGANLANTPSQALCRAGLMNLPRSTLGATLVYH